MATSTNDSSLRSVLERNGFESPVCYQGKLYLEISKFLEKKHTQQYNKTNGNMKERLSVIRRSYPEVELLKRDPFFYVSLENIVQMCVIKFGKSNGNEDKETLLEITTCLAKSYDWSDWIVIN